MHLSRAVQLFGFSSVVLALAGCTADATSGEATPKDITASSASALVDEGGATATPSNPDVRLGRVTDQTCFLQGVGGDLIGQPYYYSDPPFYNPAKAGVYADSTDGYWHLRVSPGIGTGVSAEAVCVDSVINRNYISGGNNVASSGYTGNANTQCFLQSVAVSSGLASSGNQLAIVQSGNTWYMSANVANTVGDTGWGSATGVCIDLPGTWPQVFNDLGSNPYQLVDWEITSMPVNSGTVCGLTGLDGQWYWSNWDGHHPEPFGSSDGVMLHNWINGSFTANWHAYVTNGRKAHITCRR
jgi:hypothetical protein